MNKLIKYIWITLVVLVAGCSKGDPQDDGTGPGTGQTGGQSTDQQGMVSMYLNLLADGRLTAYAGPGSRAAVRAAVPDETAVNDMWILQFDTESSAEGSLIHRVYIPTSEIAQSGTSLTAPVMLRENASSVIVVVANAPESFTAELLPDGTKLTELRRRTFQVTSTVGTSLPTDASSYLPMYGETEQMNVSMVGSSSVPVKLTRLVSRMSLTLNNNFTSGYPRFELNEITLHNAPTKIAYGPLTATTTYLGDVFPEASKDNFRDYDPVSVENVSAAQTSCMWYIAPNRRGTGTGTTSEEKSAITAPDGQGNYCSYVAIKGMVKYTEVASWQEVSYNIYLGCDEIADYNLWANAAYNVELTIAGFNEDEMEVGYDGFGITVGPLDGMADNTITGWHPDTGLEYIPKFLAYAPDRIDFGNAEYPAAQKVTFRINSSWRFSYTSGDRRMVVDGSSVAANTDQTGGAQGEPAECEVTFSPVIYQAAEGTPAAGTQYNTVATFSTVGGSVTDIRTTVFLRTVPTFIGNGSVSPSSGWIEQAGGTVTATLATNTRWSLSVSPGGTATQAADTYASRNLKITVPANNTWSTRTVSINVICEDKKQGYTLRQYGMTVDAVSISPDPSTGISAYGASYTVTAEGSYQYLNIRARSGETVLATGYVRRGSGSSGTGTLSVPTNTTESARTVTFEYEKAGSWITIKSGTQDYTRVVPPTEPTDPSDPDQGGQQTTPESPIIWINTGQRLQWYTMDHFGDIGDFVEGYNPKASYNLMIEQYQKYGQNKYSRGLEIFPALNYCYELTTGNVSKGTWRIPTYDELYLIAEYEAKHYVYWDSVPYPEVDRTVKRSKERYWTVSGHLAQTGMGGYATAVPMYKEFTYVFVATGKPLETQGYLSSPDRVRANIKMDILCIREK